LASADNGIVIQVLGELSNNGAPSQKFAQTFFLAVQGTKKNSYYVLNDIFRYIKEDIDSDFEDEEQDSANEVDVPLREVEMQHSSNGLANGFNSVPHPFAAEDSPVNSVALPYSPGEAPINPLIEAENLEAESSNTAEQRSDLPQEKVPESPPPADQTPALNDLASSEHEDVAAVERPTVVLQSEPKDTKVENPATVAIPVGPVPKTWASLAATNAEKWHAPTEQRSSSSLPPTGLPRANGNQSVPRKDTPRVVHQGKIVVALADPSDKQEPALGYIKHVGPRIQKSALGDALAKFGPLRDLDINRQKVMNL